MPKFVDNRNEILRQINEHEIRDGNERETNETIDFLVSRYAIPEQVAIFALENFRPIHAITIATLLEDEKDFTAQEGYNIALLAKEQGIPYKDAFSLASSLKLNGLSCEQGFKEYYEKELIAEMRAEALRYQSKYVDSLMAIQPGLSHDDAAYLVIKFGEDSFAEGFPLHYYLAEREFVDFIEEDEHRISPAIVFDDIVGRVKKVKSTVPVSNLNPASHKKVANLFESGDHNGIYEPIGGNWEADYAETRIDNSL